MEGAALLSIYSAGLGIPFLILSLFIGFILGFIKKANRILKYINTVAGIILAIVGILLITDKLFFIVS